MTDLGNNAKKYSLKLLGYRGRSEGELRERLGKKGFPEKIIAGTLEYLKKNGFIDDNELAVNLQRQALDNRLLGYRGAQIFMLKRGLSTEVIGSVLRYDEDLELENALKLIEKKLKKRESRLSLSEKRKTWNFLVRRGYSSDTVKKAFRCSNINQEEDEQ